VSPTGKDIAAGTGPGSAWRTIARSVRTAAPGDTIILADGVYRETLKLDGLRQSGDGAVTYRAENARRAIIDADGDSYCVGADVEWPRNVVLEGLKLRNAKMGIGFDLGANGLTLRNCEVMGCLEAVRLRAGGALVIADCYIHDNENGVILGVRDVSGVRGVTIERTILRYNAQEGMTGNRDGVAMEGLCTDVVIRDCVAYGSGDSGFDLKPDNVVLERCRSFANGQWGIKLWGNGARLSHCLTYGNHIGGMGCSGENLEFRNCTFGPNGSEGLRLETRVPESCVIRNCIFYETALQSTRGGLPSEDYNCYYTTGDSPVIRVSGAEYRLADVALPVTGMGRHNITTNPLFANPRSGSYRLLPASPCLAAGMGATINPLPQETPLRIRQ
jgi:hypothetical protein